MILVQASMFSLLLITVANGRSFTPDLIVNAAPISQIANITYGLENNNQGSLTSIFSPRMDFEQWKPLTGRGDPLRNDPTYDYEPPVLDKVHYWADETRLEREHFPERKSEVLMLGVSSRKPSVTSRQPPLPPLPPRRHVHRPLPNKYEDYTYKLSEHYPMTILVPPPPPPPGHQLPLFTLSEDKASFVNNVKSQIHPNKVPSTSSPLKLTITDSTATSEHLSSFYALQESNLIYQSSSTTQNWVNTNETKSVVNNAVSSDYAGWGPTTPVDDSNNANETHNFISNDHIEFSKHPYSFYKPMLSESPPPSKKVSSFIMSTFIPTALPPTTLTETSTEYIQETLPTERTTEVLGVPTEFPQDVTTTKKNVILLQPTTIPSPVTRPEIIKFDMLRPMMSMPMINGPERPEDNLYAHASENIQIFNEHSTEQEIETMQTMQPPPPVKQTESSTVMQKQQFHVNSEDSNKNTITLYTHGPYLHGRFTTPIATTIDEYSENIKSTTELPTVPMYLIIQGHSKVKTYGSKLKLPDSKDTITNEISKPMETNEVKHLHPVSKKSAKKIDSADVYRKGKANNLKTLVDEGLGSIEIQEADIGIKYDVSDGSDVPVEIYRKGIVDNDENNYSSNKINKKTRESRSKRQIDLEDLFPFDEDDIEEYVYNFLEGKKNETGITGLIAKAVTSDAASAVDELENDDDILDEER